LIALPAVCFCGCVIVNITSSNTVTGKGDPEKYEIKTGVFSGIIIEGYCNINYYPAPSDIITLEVQPNLREYYTVEVINGDLVVRNTKKINISSNKTFRPVLTVSTPVLNRLIVTGAGTFTAHDKITTDTLSFMIRGAGSGKAELDAEYFSAIVSGAGNLELSGKADIAELSISGTGTLNAFELETRDATVNLSGSGTVRMGVSENLHISASGAGSVEYKGTPGLSLNTSGAVRIRQVD